MGLAPHWSLLLVALALAAAAAPRASAQGRTGTGMPADLASSAYRYDAGAGPANPPEAWILLMQHLGLPYYQPIGPATPGVSEILTGLLWEEVRPVRSLTISWPASAKRVPTAADLRVTIFETADDTAHTWWNPRALRELALRSASRDGRTLTYAVPVDTWGVVVSVPGRAAAEFDRPTVRATTPEAWKRAEIEIEWGFAAGAGKAAFDGEVTGYDAVISHVAPMPGDAATRVSGAGWTSPPASGRRGIRLEALYIGSARWRKVWPYLAQPEDVSRSLITVRTRSGGFTFNVADLEHGPILAPEYGFFVRALSIPKPTPAATAEPAPRLMAQKVEGMPGVPKVRGWNAGETPWVGANPDAEAGVAGSLSIPGRCVAMHPGSDRSAAAGWVSPIAGRIRVSGGVAMADSAGGTGVQWRLLHTTAKGAATVASGDVGMGGSARIAPAEALAVAKGDEVALVIAAKNGAHQCCTTVVNLTIEEADGGQTWDLTRDTVGDILSANPHADASGRPGIWRFTSSETVSGSGAVHEPPFAMASRAATARGHLRELRARGLQTIRRRTRKHAEQTWEGAVRAMIGDGDLPPTPAPPFEPAMKVATPDARLNAQWKLGAWHILRQSKQGADGTWRFNDFPFGILASETYMILRALDLQGMHKEAADGLDQWLKLPLTHRITPGADGHHTLALPDKPLGHFSDGDGSLTHAEGIEGWGGHMDAVHAMGPGAIAFALSEHFRLTGDRAWLRANLPRMRANVDWILRQRRVLSGCLPGGERLWSKGLQPAHVVTPDSMSMHMQYFESEAYYWLAVRRAAEMVALEDPAEGRKLAAEAEAYRKDLVAAIDRAILLTPVTPVRDGTYRSFIPFAPYVRGFAAGAWGWKRCQGHVGAIYWDTVQSADPLVSPSGLLSPTDPRVQGHLDVLEDRLLLENTKVVTRTPQFDAERDWFSKAGWQYQCGLERHANIHLAGDDPTCFLRAWLNQYAVDLMPGEYTFREHTTGGPPDKIYEESCFLERFRQMLVCETGGSLWINRATPREWLADGKQIAVADAPTHFGPLTYRVTSHMAQGRVEATINLPSRSAPIRAILRLRSPGSAPIRSVTVNGKPWASFNAKAETIALTGCKGMVEVVARY